MIFVSFVFVWTLLFVVDARLICRIEALLSAEPWAVCTSLQYPLIGIPNTANESEYDAQEDSVYPIFHGGIGNHLFQISALAELARQHGRPLVLGYFDHYNSYIPGFGPWGGHPAPFRGATWCDFLENVRCMRHYDDPPYIRHILNGYAYDINHTAEYVEFPVDLKKGAVFIQGYFFNHRYHHHANQLIVFSARIRETVDFLYRPLYSVHTTVSLHVRIGFYEPERTLLEERKRAPLRYWADALREVEERARGSRSLALLVFSDSPANETLQFLYDALGRPVLPRHFFIDEDSATSIYMMSLCQYHIMSASTFSFWGARLAAADSTVFLHETFFVDHGHEMIDLEDKRWNVLQ